MSDLQQQIQQISPKNGRQCIAYISCAIAYPVRSLISTLSILLAIPILFLVGDREIDRSALGTYGDFLPSEGNLPCRLLANSLLISESSRFPVVIFRLGIGLGAPDAVS